MDFSDLLREKLNTKTLKPTGESASGCINEGEVYLTDKGKVFVKKNAKPQARLMFDGEFVSLEEMLATNSVTVPKPLAVVDCKVGSVLVLEYLEMKSLSKYSAKLGEQLAEMHLHNVKKKENLDPSSLHKKKENSKYISQFGFQCTTCCGYIPQDNSWEDNWITFFARNKLHAQIELTESKFGDREAIELWSHLEPKLPQFFRDIDIIPSLLHGDLWSGNAAENNEGPIIFDPASFYGHAEFDLSISKLFGGFNESFFNSYHKIIPKEKGYNDRLELYKLFHYLNHWNHFGGGYRGSSISTMKKLIKKF